LFLNKLLLWNLYKLIYEKTISLLLEFISEIYTVFYFSYFLIILSVIGIIENTLFNLGTHRTKSINTALKVSSKVNTLNNPFRSNQIRNFHKSPSLKDENNQNDNEKDNEKDNDLDINFKTWLLNNKPAKIYLNSAESALRADYLWESKNALYSENNGKSRIYLWLNITNDKYYIGSAKNLTRRFSQYYSEKYLKAVKGIIHKALLKNKHEKFALYILEYCEVKELILREQYYIDMLTPQYNILKIAGSTVGFKHTEESLVKMSEAKTG
jgi:predicted GIY-YIG superfamily endonuclease